MESDSKAGNASVRKITQNNPGKFIDEGLKNLCWGGENSRCLISLSTGVH